MSVGRGEKTKEIQKLPASKLEGGISIFQHGDGWSKPRGIDPAPILSKMREKKHPGWMPPPACCLSSPKPRVLALKHSKPPYLFFFFCFFLPLHCLCERNTQEDLEKRHWPETAVFVSPPTPLLLCVKETRLPNDAENSQ